MPSSTSELENMTLSQLFKMIHIAQLDLMMVVCYQERDGKFSKHSYFFQYDKDFQYDKEKDTRIAELIGKCNDAEYVALFYHHQLNPPGDASYWEMVVALKRTDHGFEVLHPRSAEFHRLQSYLKNLHGAYSTEMYKSFWYEILSANHSAKTIPG